MRLRLILILLFVACFSLALSLETAQETREITRERGGNVLALLLGDTRKMFANQFFAKADAYFHRGNYPSIFDQETRHEENHMAGEAAHHHDGDDDDDEHEAPPPAHDWIERFERHFHPSEHVHLEGGNVREILPWLRISTALDPHRIETYTVTAYWLAERLNEPDQAERLLRQGLRANPNSPELLNELARIFYEIRHDPARAKNVWTLALRRWHEVDEPKEKPNQLLHLQILGGLARIENEAGNYGKVIEYLKEMKTASPSPEAIQKQIDALEAKIK